MLLTGVSRKSGKFIPQGQQKEIEFDNLMFEFESTDKTNLICGKVHEVIKIKSRDFSNAFPNVKIEDLYGKDFEFTYDRFGKVSGLKANK